MARNTRSVLPPPRLQAAGREAFVTDLRTKARYRNIVTIDLRQLWNAVPAPAITPLSILDEVQHGYHDARRWRAARAVAPTVIDRLDADAATHAASRQVALEAWGVARTPELRNYLTANEISITHDLGITDHGEPPWWLMCDAHDDVTEHQPLGWTNRVDWWRFADVPPSPRMIFQVEGSEDGARLTTIDPTTKKPVSTLMLRMDNPHHAFQDHDSVLQHAVAEHLQEFRAALDQHYQTGKERTGDTWFKNPPSETRMMREDIPKLVAWYVGGDGDDPTSENEKRRLNDIARTVLGLDPPASASMARKNRRESRTFFAELGARYAAQSKSVEKPGGA